MTVRYSRHTSRHTSRYTSKKKSNIKTLKKKNLNTKNSIRIFSYNISWESMTGAKPQWSLCSNNTDSKHPKHNSICVSNIAGVIEDNPADFVLLQEATDYKNLIKDSNNLSKMKYEEHNSEKDEMVTFWNKKYKKIVCVKGEFEKGRPWMAILFSNGLCLINVHMGHYTDREEVVMLDKMLKKIKNYFIHKDKLDKIQRIIIGGDFNNNIKNLSHNNTLNIDNTNFYHHPKKILTCCINRYTHYDHVIDSLQLPLDIIIPDVHHMASDHKPILVSLVSK